MSAAKRLEEQENVPSFATLMKRRPPAIVQHTGTVIAVEEEITWFNDDRGSTHAFKPGDQLGIACVECGKVYRQEAPTDLEAGDKLPERGLCPTCEGRPFARAVLKKITEHCDTECSEACDRACGCMWEMFERELIRAYREARA